ncbi:hypothetical protein BJV77DRAFT_187461 [Russula vinacea]|nr:hypothetical protein BJV77DRAFT_187461 [Russula vinacea]
MVSDLSQACLDGDLNKVNQLLPQASPLDIEEKDGITPLIAAVKNGHHDVVKALLGHGANPAHASTQGLPEQYTSDATIVELLRTAAIAKVNPDAPHQDPRFIHDPNVGPPKAYYMPHPGPYAYYPGIPVPPLPEGAMPYYPHPLPHPRRPRHRRTTKAHPQRAAISPTFLLPRLLGSFRVGTSLPVATEPLASSPILRVRITRAPCRRLPSTRLPMSSHLTLRTFILCLHPSPSFNPRMAYPLPTTCPPSLHSQQHSQSHHHPRSS